MSLANEKALPTEHHTISPSEILDYFLMNQKSTSIRIGECSFLLKVPKVKEQIALLELEWYRFSYIFELVKPLRDEIQSLHRESQMYNQTELSHSQIKKEFEIMKKRLDQVLLSEVEHQVLLSKVE
jgi:hypothetical protein